jgi:hypothetical protein
MDISDMANQRGNIMKHQPNKERVPRIVGAAVMTLTAARAAETYNYK